MKKIIIFFIFALVASFGYAEEKSPPDPNQLNTGWWSYFAEDQKDVPEKIAVFEESLKKMVGQINGPLRDQANSELDKIHTHLQAYLAAIALKDPPNTPLSPIAKHYSLHHTLEIYRSIKKTELELKSYGDELAEKQKQLNCAQDNLDQFSVAYAKAVDRSEEKTMSALQVINNQAALEAAKRSISHVNLLIEQDNKQVQALKDEVEQAINRISVNHMDLKNISQAVASSEQAWSEEKKQLEAKEQEHIPQNLADQSELAEARHQRNTQDLIHQKLREADARNQLIYNKIMFSLARIIQEPHSADPTALRAMAADWLNNIKDQRSQVDEWTENLRKLYLRYTQLVTMGNSGNKDAQEIAELQKDVIKQARANFLILQGLSNTLDDSSFLLDEVDHRVTGLLGSKERYLLDILDFSHNSWNQAVDLLNKPLIHINDKPITTFSLLRFLLIMTLAIWLSRFVANALTQFSLTRHGIHKSLVYKITRLVKYLILTVGLIIALSAIGFDFSSLLLIAGALGVGLGFGLQSIFNNFISGLIILFESHLKVGDIIELPGVKGEVREINVRSTIVTTGEGSEVIIPNSEIISNKVINWTMNDSFRKLHLPFSVAADSDKNLVAKVIEEKAATVKTDVPQTGVTAPRVSFIKFGDNSIDFELTVWFDQRFGSTRGATSDYLWAIDDALRQNGIKRPGTELDVTLKKE